ncbi:peptidase inhibitor family I36 protein [Streptomyces sp. WZ.A104]|uniref:peptidase inhibitor family I36 protein n=1 Tax=Streptomyces sp. WZ.A104 TaxID=2023771 RepID=UPI00211CCACB|nr:peptidase inhibitor family I36 protein [Streptomyces sp. WZ.A104]
MRTRTKLAVTLSASAMAVFGLAGPTSASTSLDSTIATQAEQAGLNQSEVADLQKQIDEQMAITPGGKQIGVNQVSWRDGKAIMTFPLPGEKQARAVGESVGTLGTANCSYLWTCLYEHSNFDGRRLTWSDCAFHDLSTWGFNDKTSSWHNNQSRGTVTRVYNWTGSWTQLWASSAPAQSSYVGSSNNDKADGIRVC